MAKACRQTIAVRPIDASNINILNIIIHSSKFSFRIKSSSPIKQQLYVLEGVEPDFAACLLEVLSSIKANSIFK